MAGFFGHGASITFDSIAVAGVLDIPLPEEEREEVETTDMDSDFHREFVPGLIDGGTLDFTLRRVPGDPGQAAIRANQATQQVVEVVITGPAHMSPQETVTFQAYVQTTGGTYFWESTAAEFTFTLRVASAPVFGSI